MSVIKFAAICKSYYPGGGELVVLKNIDLAIEQGDMVAIMGPSGSGKSTIMNILGLLDRPSSGQYFLSGRDVSQLKDDEQARFRGETIGFVFQSFYLLAKLNALQNVQLPLRYQRVNHASSKQRSQAMLSRVGMANYLQHKPTQLSGGQQQRVAIARALVTNPSVILADEPTGALDTKTGQDIMALFTALNRDEKKTVVIITHDPRIAAQCQKVIHLMDGSITHIEQH